MSSNSPTLKIKNKNTDHKAESTGNEHFRRCIRIWMCFFYWLRPVCNSRMEIGQADKNIMKLHIIKYYDMLDSKKQKLILFSSTGCLLSRISHNVLGPAHSWPDFYLFHITVN